QPRPEASPAPGLDSQRGPPITGPWTPPAVCGRPRMTGRIVSGQDAQLGQWPWQVSLRENGEHVCGGSLIAEDWVLTAAHCFHQTRPSPPAPFLPHLNHRVPSRGPVHHLPRLFGEARHWGHRLVQLASPVNFTDLILPVCLPKPGDPLGNGTWCWVTGWGNICRSAPHPALPPPFTLKEVNVPLIDTQTCDAYYQENSNNPSQEPIIFEDMLCAGFESGQKDACGGDSGGPLVCDVGVWTQAGIVSWGYDCGLPKRPGVYINVSVYTTWITSQIQSSAQAGGQKGIASSRAEPPPAPPDPRGCPRKHLPFPVFQTGRLRASSSRACPSTVTWQPCP
uniref:Peptidase S1 domain-containing protein n=1 Tax=Canis lupus familiaris TaxID=9615 RepID=A0A8C0RAP3_CANLF